MRVETLEWGGFQGAVSPTWDGATPGALSFVPHVMRHLSIKGTFYVPRSAVDYSATGIGGRAWQILHATSSDAV